MRFLYGSDHILLTDVQTWRVLHISNWRYLISSSTCVGGLWRLFFPKASVLHSLIKWMAGDVYLTIVDSKKSDIKCDWSRCIMTWLYQQTHTNTVSSYKACPIFLIYFCFIMQEGLCNCSVFLLSIIYQHSSLSLRRDSAQESVSVTHQSNSGQPCGQNLKTHVFVCWLNCRKI